ncbi:MAG: hypothetical protein JEY99_07330 [Spirochaetales bacterium]|nr:hypothetical protein [Spirochaetales bacterium]
MKNCKISLIIVLFLIAVSFNLSAQNSSVARVDRNAVLKENLQNTFIGDYKVVVFPNYPILRFRSSENTIILAQYNWKEQYWVGTPAAGFDKNSIPLLDLYSSVILTPEELNRDYPGRNVVQATGKNQVQPRPTGPGQSQTIIEESPKPYPAEPHPASGSYYRVDNHAVLSEDAHHRVFGNVWVLTFENSSTICFRPVNTCTPTLASYNWEKQYWISKTDSFDISLIDLPSLYDSCLLSEEEMNRGYPGENLVQATASNAPNPNNHNNQQTTPASPSQPSRPSSSEELPRVDSTAVLSDDAHHMVFGDYWVLTFANSEIICFRPVNTCTPTLASYNWKKQYWISMVDDFDKSIVDLTALYQSILLTPEELDRGYPGENLVQARGTNQIHRGEDTPATPTPQGNPSGPMIGPGRAAPAPNQSAAASSQRNSSPSHQPAQPAAPRVEDNHSRVDRNAVLKQGLNQTIIGDYKIMVYPNYNFIQFKPASNGYATLATYNWKEQWWGSVKPEFDKSQIDLMDLYQSVGLTAEEMDRSYPGTELVQVE